MSKFSDRCGMNEYDVVGVIVVAFFSVCVMFGYWMGA